MSRRLPDAPARAGHRLRLRGPGGGGAGHPASTAPKRSPAIDECVIFCPGQTHLVAVVSPATRPADADAIHARLASANATFGRDEQIKGLVIAPERFSIANGMLTSQYKPRRSQIFQAHRRQISAATRRDGDGF